MVTSVEIKKQQVGKASTGSRDSQLRLPKGNGWWTGMSEKELQKAAERLAKAIPRGVCN